MGCRLPGSSVHGIFQAIVLEWIAISFSRGSSQPKDRTWVSRIVDRHFTVWATREVGDGGDPGTNPGSGRSAGEGLGYPLQYSWAPLVAQLVKNLPAMWRPGFNPWVGKIPWRRERVTTPVFWPGEFHRLSPWGHKELDTTERFSLHFTSNLIRSEDTNEFISSSKEHGESMPQFSSTDSQHICMGYTPSPLR